MNKTIIETKNKKIKIIELKDSISIYVNWKNQSRNINKENFYSIIEWIDFVNEIEKISLKNNVNDVFWDLISLKLNRNEDWLNINYWDLWCLTEEMLSLFDFLNDKKIRWNYFLVWWTAFSLLLWHRESIDYDLFTCWKQLSWKEILELVEKYWLTLWNNSKWFMNLKNSNEILWQYDFSLNWVNITLFDTTLRVLYEDERIYFTEFLEFDNFPVRIASLKQLYWSKTDAISSRIKKKDFYDLALVWKIYWISFIEMIEEAKKQHWNYFDHKKILLSINVVLNRNWDFEHTEEEHFEYNFNHEEIIWKKNKLTKEEMLEFFRKWKEDIEKKFNFNRDNSIFVFIKNLFKWK